MYVHSKKMGGGYVTLKNVGKLVGKLKEHLLAWCGSESASNKYFIAIDNEFTTYSIYLNFFVVTSEWMQRNELNIYYLNSDEIFNLWY